MKNLPHTLNVSRETLTKLEEFVSLVLKWNKAINLIGKSTEKDIWNRHILDSLQILPLVEGKTVMDIGTGAGFPGMILALSGAKDVLLVEKNGKKCAFLHQVKSNLGINCNIYNSRIEDIDSVYPEVITCRAFASIEKILLLIEKFVTQNVTIVLLKGENYQKEIQEAQDMGWIFEYNSINSITETGAVVLILKHIKRK